MPKFVMFGAAKACFTGPPLGCRGSAVFVCEVQKTFFDEFSNSDQQGVTRMLVLGAEGGARIRRVVFPAEKHGERT